MKHVLVSPLSWGLGHATRDLPVIRHLVRRGHKVTIAAIGRALSLLQHELPDIDFVELPDYPTPYTSSRHFVRKFVAMSPLMLSAVWREGRRVKRLLRRRRFDMILSDNRFNVRSDDIPSFVISHQLRFMVPKGLRRLEGVTEFFNWEYLKPFDRVIVPDNGDPVRNLSGRMSHDLKRLPMEQIYYAGSLASVRCLDLQADVDLFVSISGPEPQRTELERILLDQVRDVPGERIVVTLGKPETVETCGIDDRIAVYGYLDRERQQEMLNRAKLVVCRSGYTTVMELAELRKQALFIPTPGQTEQEYLAEYYEENGFFHSVSQYKLDLAADVEKARSYPGVPFETDTAANVERLYDELFAPVLDR